MGFGQESLVVNVSVMAWGLLWYDPEGTLEERVGRGAFRYKKKYGHAPNTCYAYPQSVKEEEPVMAGCKVLFSPVILKDHLWIGVTE
jgi:hypothetical protein